MPHVKLDLRLLEHSRGVAVFRIHEHGPGAHAQGGSVQLFEPGGDLLPQLSAGADWVAVLMPAAEAHKAAEHLAAAAGRPPNLDELLERLLGAVKAMPAHDDLRAAAVDRVEFAWLAIRRAAGDVVLPHDPPLKGVRPRAAAPQKGESDA